MQPSFIGAQKEQQQIRFCRGYAQKGGKMAWNRFAHAISCRCIIILHRCFLPFISLKAGFGAIKNAETPIGPSKISVCIIFKRYLLKQICSAAIKKFLSISQKKLFSLSLSFRGFGTCVNDLIDASRNLSHIYGTS